MRSARRPWSATALSGFLGLLALAPGPYAAGAEEAREFFKGKTVTIKVAASPGGTFDLIPRLVSERIRKATGAKAVVVQTDLRRFIASANAFARLRKPGLHLMHINGAVTLWNQITKAPGVKHDLAKFKWLASMAPIGNVLFKRGDLPYKTFDDLKKAGELKFGGGGRFSTTPVAYAMMCANFDLKCRFVLGYRGAAPGILALKSKEVDLYGATSTLTALRERDAIKNGQLGIFTITGPNRIPPFPDIPTWLELGGDSWKEPYKSWAKRLEVVLSKGMSWVMPPEAPDDIVEFMRGVIKETYADPDIAKLFKDRIGSSEAVSKDFVGGVETQKRVAQLLGEGIGEKDIKWLADHVNRYVP